MKLFTFHTKRTIKTLRENSHSADKRVKKGIENLEID